MRVQFLVVKVGNGDYYFDKSGVGVEIVWYLFVGDDKEQQGVDV